VVVVVVVWEPDAVVVFVFVMMGIKPFPPPS